MDTFKSSGGVSEISEVSLKPKNGETSTAPGKGVGKRLITGGGKEGEAGGG